MFVFIIRYIVNVFVIYMGVDCVVDVEYGYYNIF